MRDNQTRSDGSGFPGREDVTDDLDEALSILSKAGEDARLGTGRYLDAAETVANAAETRPVAAAD